MTDSEKISEELGSEMVVIDNNVLSQCDLPLSTKDWLATVGIPKTAQLPFGLILNGSYNLKPIPQRPQTGLSIGETDGPSYMVIRRDGTVVMLCEGDDPENFVNSSISQFIMSLCILPEFFEYKITVKELETRLIQIDPKATRSEDAFWALVIEDAINLT